MYSSLLLVHSYVRYVVLALLIVVIVTSLLGMLNKRSFGKSDNLLSLFLLIFTHIQALAGLILYFISPAVIFGSSTMKNATIRYWTVEHIFAMLFAVVLITVARSTSKRMTNDQAKHKRLFIFNLIALVVIVVTIWLGGMGLFTVRG
jgi:heme A synthase